MFLSNMVKLPWNKSGTESFLKHLRNQKILKSFKINKGGKFAVKIIFKNVLFHRYQGFPRTEIIWF